MCLPPRVPSSRIPGAFARQPSKSDQPKSPSTGLLQTSDDADSADSDAEDIRVFAEREQRRWGVEREGVREKERF